MLDTQLVYTLYFQVFLKIKSLKKKKKKSLHTDLFRPRKKSSLPGTPLNTLNLQPIKKKKKKKIEAQRQYFSFPAK